MATQDLLKIKVFWSKAYNAIISVHDVTSNILSRDSNYVVDLSYDQSLLTLTFLWMKLS